MEASLAGMEAPTGRAGDRGLSSLRPWSYPRGNQMGSKSSSCDNSIISSSSSGTIVSAAYTSRGSRLSSVSMDAAVKHFELLALDEDTAECVVPINKSCTDWEQRTKHMDIESLVQEFFGAPPSAERSSINNINSNSTVLFLERWFLALGVAWVLHLPDADADADAEGDDASAQLHAATAAERWIRGLHRILETICSTSSMFSSGLPDVCEEEEDQSVPESDNDKQAANNVPDQIHFARFIKQVMSKMLPFVDFAIRQVVVCVNNGTPAAAPYKKLHTLLAVYEALSDAPARIWSSFCSTSAEAVRILDEMVSLVSAKQEEAGAAIWSTMETITARVLGSIDIAEYVEDSLIVQASSDIHQATSSLMEYIKFLLYNSSTMCQIVSKAVLLGTYVVPHFRQGQPMDNTRAVHHLDNMIMNMESCLQEKLVKVSESFPDQGLRFLFLLNNIRFIRQSLVDTRFSYWFLYTEGNKGLYQKEEGYIKNYLQACWDPVLSCLFSPTPLCFGINHSPLLKFESEFNKAYASQRLWKVPDPSLRERLRRAITKKIVPRYTKYLEENSTPTPSVAPQDLEKMLQELFEG